MKDAAWRERLAAEIEKTGMSKRAISLAAKSGPGYVHSILTEGKDPTVEKLIAVCDVLDVSPAYILHGINASPGEVEILKLIKDNPSKRDAILALLGQ